MKKIIILICFSIQSVFVFGQNQNISNGNVFDGEPYLSINPNNPQHLVVAWMGWVDLANQIKIKLKTSFDGGQTWSLATELPHIVSTYTSADPSVEFNKNGDVFVCYVDFTGTDPPVTGGVYLCKSTDGGLTWGTPTEVINTSFDGTKWPIDRPWLEIDRSSGANQNNIYVTTMNLNRTNPSFNPYLSVSVNGGNTFTTKYLDAPSWLAGSTNPLPMSSPSVTASGVFLGSYPSYEVSQSLYPQYFLASSTNGATTFSYTTILSLTDPIPLSSFPSAKKGQLLIANPINSNHLAFIFLRTINGDLDVFFMETFDLGVSWSSSLKINDDPIGNNIMQDLVWADFDADGDIIISWRDRRNSIEGTYQTPTEIWAAYRDKDAIQFSPNFQITNEAVPYNSILENSGNDFMCIKLQDDFLNAVWGDTRNEYLNIWFQRMDIDGTVLSTQQISSEKIQEIFIYPNPSVTTVYIESKSKDLKKVTVYNLKGEKLVSKRNKNGINKVIISLENYSSGIYFIKATTAKGEVTQKIVKE